MSVEETIGIARLSLAGYQQQAMEGLQGAIRRVGWYHQDRPKDRLAIGRQSGVMLLQAPTGSGKTLVLGRTLEGLRGDVVGKIVWFWFAPYAGLVTQTRDALSVQCGSLRLRDLTKDREASGARDGDVFVQTWAALAARNADSKRVRRTTERVLSADDMIADLRADGFQIGVVIDEAHLNFGTNAGAAADLYLNVLSPDYTILATATPHDDKLEQFERSAGLVVANRIVIDRAQVVAAGLNKVGLMLGFLRFKEGEERLIDIEQATLTAAWNQHELVKRELSGKGINVVPLMLVQVEDQAKGGEDPIKRVRDKLEQAGVPAEKIKSHTSGQPDPEFHTLAYDPDVEVLIFKVSVATGFDAPRAWTLVSVRPNRGVEFGLQIVGRIMRVHPAVRPSHGQNPLLDRGYVFLSAPELQAGLNAAVDELKAVRQGIELITDHLDLYEFGDSEGALSLGVVRGPMLSPTLPKTAAERIARLDALIEIGLIHGEIRDEDEATQLKAIFSGETVRTLGETALFSGLPEQLSPKIASNPGVRRGLKRYRLRTELEIPSALWQEELPPIHEIQEKLVTGIARNFCTDDLLADLRATRRKADLSLKDLFIAGDVEHREISVRLSNARVSEQAQAEFEFNDSIDPRNLKRALYDRLEALADEKGIEGFEKADVRRAIDLAVMRNPERLRDALRRAQADYVTLTNALPIPTETTDWPDDLKPALKGAYGVFPERLNQEEQAFAELLDADESGKIRWWLKNPENERWATRLVLPNGKRFFPDFAVGVQGRSSRDAVALVEIKDDGETGRLHSDNNALKIRVQHREYGKVCWTYRTAEKRWVRAVYNDALNRIIDRDVFKIADLVLID